MTLKSKISRWIAFGGAALSAVVATFVSNEAQILFNLNLSKATLVAYIGPFTLGAFAAAYKWLDNRGAQELTQLEHDLGISPSIIAELEKLLNERLPNPPAAKK